MAEGIRVTKTTEAKAETSSSRMRNAEHSPSINSPVEQILFLQRTAGNQAVQRLIKKRALQAKLKTSQPNDIHEWEADRVAEKVMRIPDSLIQKQTNSEEEKEDIIQTKPLVNHITPSVQRQVEAEKEEEPIQRKKADQTSEVSSDIHTIITSLRGGGQPLPDHVRGYFEPRFGQDFGNVRVHTDSNAILAAQAINAKAFTIGHEVVFGAGQYAPDTIEGKRLLGHELTHVIQQGGKRNSINAKKESDENLSWLEKAKKWAFEKALDAAGIPKEQMMGLVRRAGNAIRGIFEDPGRFLSTLIKAVGQGFAQFKDKIGEHLKAGFMGWLFGTMTKAGIELPKDFSLKSILTLVLQVLGITSSLIRQKFVKLIGEKNVKRFEKAWQALSTLMSEGIGGLWNMLKEHLGNLKEMVIDEIKNWVITEIIKSAVMKVVSMFNPVSGLITIIKTIYNVIKFLIERARQIKELFAAIVDSVAELAMGSISNAANKIEQALSRLIPIAIGFLASLLGIGGITDKIKEIIKRVSSMVDKAIDKVLEKAVKPFVKKLKGFLEKGKEKVIGAGKKVAGAIAGWLGIKKQFKVREGEQHTLYFNSSRQLMMASSRPVIFGDFVNTIKIPNNPEKQARLNRLKADIAGQLRLLDATISNTAMPEDKKHNQIHALLELIGPKIAKLIRETSGVILRSEAPQYGGLHSGFGSSMRVRIVNGDPATRGSKPSVTGGHWDNLKKRKTSLGSSDTFYIRAHLLNDNLGGPGDDWHNLSVLSQKANNRDWYESGSHEAAVESRLKGPLSEPGKGFIYVVTANYSRSRNTRLINTINDLINHKNNPTTMPDPVLPSNLSYLNSYSGSQLGDIKDIVSSEEFVPTEFVCTIVEIDPSTGEKVSGSDHNIKRPIQNDIQGDYFV